MSNQIKFNLTKAMKHQGFTLMINWAGGLFQVTTWKDGQKNVQKVQKTVQSVHRISAATIKNWLDNSTSGYWKPGEWQKRSESVRIQEHIEDFIHDQRGKGTIVSWYIQETEN